MTRNLTRRSLLKSVGGGLVVAMVLPTLARGQAIRRMTPAEMREAPAEPNAFLRIGTDDLVTVISKHIEFGQGTYTGLATLAAEELDASWAQMRVEAAPAEVELYANLNMGQQGTGGSSSMANSYYQMRKAGAAARAMLVAAAAESWQVDAAGIDVSDGVVRHLETGRSARFGELAGLAALMPKVSDPVLKDPATFKLVGTDLRRVDGLDKATGRAVYSIDVSREGMVHSAMLHPPVFGARVADFDDSETLAVKGVHSVVRIDGGIAVIANSRVAAMRGKAALKVDWDLSRAETRSSDEMFTAYAQAARAPGTEVETRGEGSAPLERATRVIEAEYRFPFLAHAPMEPMGGVADVTPEKAEIWMASQLVTRDKREIENVLGLSPEKIDLHCMMAGGSFGRLGTPDAEFAAEVASVGKAWGKGPVKHLWDRENDIRGGRYRPMCVHRLRGALDENGSIAVWDQVIAAQSFLKDTAFDGAVRGGIDRTAVEGAMGMNYAIPNLRVGLHLMENGVSANFWRSVGSSHTCYAVETFLDRLFDEAGRDPVAGRLALISDNEPRLKAVLERVADMAGWSGGAGQDGRALGVAVTKCFRSYVAEIAEVSLGDEGLPKVNRVWCAIDCGVAINPDLIRAQLEGGIGFALGAALFDEITIAPGGEPEQGNFDLYRSLRMSEMPEVIVSILPSTADPTGVGEPGVPPLAPAVANAWRRLTGDMVTTLPFTRGIGQ